MAWLIRRLAGALATVGIVLTLVFAGIHLAPGTPFMPRGDRPPLDAVAVERLRREFGLDRPIPEQYTRYLVALAHGELGESFATHRPVRDLLVDALPNTLVLASAALLLEFLLGMLLGAIQALRTGSRWVELITQCSLFVYSVPTFWLGLMLLLVFGEWLRWLPVGGVVDPAMYHAMGTAGRLTDRLRHLVLPALTLGLVGAAGTARFQYAALRTALQQDFVRSAKAKGLTPRAVVLRHAMPNALLPMVTLIGLSLPMLLTGTVLVETVFAWPGLGRLAADAIATRDYPVVAATTLLASLLVVLGSLMADAMYAVIDPRVRFEAAR